MQIMYHRLFTIIYFILQILKVIGFKSPSNYRYCSGLHGTRSSFTSQYGGITPASIGDAAFDAVAGIASVVVENKNDEFKNKNLPINRALMKILKDMQELDTVVGRTPQLSLREIIVLSSTVFVTAASPYLLSTKVVELLVPSMAAISAAIGISAEYVGKVAVANGKEVAALAIQAAAEAEAILASAERTKAILPLCVGIATTASAFALLAPLFVADISHKFGFDLAQELYLLCPLAAVLAAAIAGLATQEAASQCARAAGVGNRRFASSSAVGRDWLSATEQVDVVSKRTSMKWSSFSSAVFVAPLFASVFPGVLSSKAIVCAAIAAAQAAYYLSSAEYSLARATEAVAMKCRAAAISDTYANQGSRAGAILPFTSALAGLCAAASAAVVELLPFVQIVELQSLIALSFPTGAALFAAAASVSKARCEVDASAASTAAATGMTGQLKSAQERRDSDPVSSVIELIKTSFETASKRLRLKFNKYRSIGAEKCRRSVTKLIQYRMQVTNRFRLIFSSRKPPLPPSQPVSPATNII